MSATAASKRVYDFSEGSRDMRMLLGPDFTILAV